MKIQTKCVLFLSMIALSAQTVTAGWYEKAIKRSEQQTMFLLNTTPDTDSIPRTFQNGKVEMVDVEDWTSGFFPGVLWMLHYHTNDANWKAIAEKYTEKLFPIQYYKGDHDVGFIMMSSYGLGYKNYPSDRSKEILVNTAKSLSTRFIDKAGTIQSWNKKKSHSGKLWEVPVIIDNMMNLELLFAASKFTGDNHFREIAIQHADNTLKNHVRPDYSTYHVVSYNATTGEVTDQDTWQGFSRNSTWARGQAWAAYGFTMCYRETGEQRYLDAAVKLTDYYLEHENLPSDLIPYWDFNVGQEGYVPDWNYTPVRGEKVLRDASAAAILSSALLELSSISPEFYDKYFKSAEKTLKKLSSRTYLAKRNTNGGFILKHSMGNFPRNSEVDVPLNYADFYFLEALYRYKTLKKVR